MLKDEYKVYEEKMKKSIDSVAADFASVRAGRANAAVLDRIMVDYYGSPTPIQQIAAISSPDPRALVISPWDSKALKSIEKAIQNSDLGINPQNDGRCIRPAISVIFIPSAIRLPSIPFLFSPAAHPAFCSCHRSVSGDPSPPASARPR